MTDSTEETMAERNRILSAMDVEAAKAFIVQHGGHVPGGPLDWVKVLHLARFEVTTLPPELITESQIYLARNGAQRIGMFPPGSAYERAALDLLFPKDVFEAYLSKLEGRPGAAS